LTAFFFAACRLGLENMSLLRPLYPLDIFQPEIRPRSSLLWTKERRPAVALFCIVDILSEEKEIF